MRLEHTTFSLVAGSTGSWELLPTELCDIHIKWRENNAIRIKYRLIIVSYFELPGVDITSGEMIFILYKRNCKKAIDVKNFDVDCKGRNK